MEVQQPPIVRKPATRKFKQPRASQACERCRSKKYKCDEAYPCVHCKSKFLRRGLLAETNGFTGHAVECVYQRNNILHRDNSK
jgi:hypothetical protein